MKLKESDDEKIVIEFTRDEFRDTKAAVGSVRQEYSVLDEVILNVSHDRIRELHDKFSDIVEKSNQLRFGNES